jgi:uncharacterized protein
VVYIVDVDGSLYGNSDPYVGAQKYLNIFEDDLSSINNSPTWRRDVIAAKRRQDEACIKCQFHGHCTGYIMAECTELEREYEIDGGIRCSVAKPVHSFIEGWLDREGIVSYLAERNQAKRGVTWHPDSGF